MLIFIIICIVVVLSLASSSNSSSSISNNNYKKNENNFVYSDEELDAMGLLDYEKEEVKKGNYDPWQFEEDEMEEDDYYY